jgi:hypothetical protein
VTKPPPEVIEPDPPAPAPPLAPFKLGKFKVASALVAKRTGKIQFRASRAGQLLVTLSRLRSGGATAFARRFSVRVQEGTNRVPVTFPRAGDYVVTVTAPGRASVGLTRVVAVRQTLRRPAKRPPKNARQRGVPATR